MQFADLIGQTVSMKIPAIHPTTFQPVKVIGVEACGIWIESQKLTNEALQSLRIATAPKNLLFFVPYSGIALLMTSGEGMALDEGAFGV
jgi:hypothetical protein